MASCDTRSHEPKYKYATYHLEGSPRGARTSGIKRVSICAGDASFFRLLLGDNNKEDKKERLDAGK